MKFLILGCQRSGTTMVAAALSRHPDIAVYDERLAYRALMNDPTVDRVGAEAIGFKIPRWTDLLPGPIKGEPDQRLSGAWAYANEPAIFIVRDPASVIASMHNLVIRDRPWIARYAIPLARSRMSQDDHLGDRFGWVEDLDPVMRKWGLGAVYWVAKNEALERYMAEGYPLFPVRYEALVEAPELWKQMIAFLGLRWNPSVVSSEAGALIGLNKSNLAAGGTDPQRAIDSESISRKDEVSPHVHGLVDAIVGDLPRRIALLCAEATSTGLARPSP